MRRHRYIAALAFMLLALVLAAPASAAPGIALAWDHCLSEGTGVQNKMFACDTNVGSNVMVGTFELTRAFDGVNGAEIVVQLQSASPALPPWWRLFNAPAACRPNGLSVNNVAADLSCPDWGAPDMMVFLATYCTSDGSCVDHPGVANQARLKLVEAVPSSLLKNLNGLQPYFAFNMVVNRQSTVGATACAGCDVPVCIVLNSIKVTSFGQNRFISNASVPGGNFVTWQGGGPGCPAATPTKNQTWGAVKSMYR